MIYNKALGNEDDQCHVDGAAPSEKDSFPKGRVLIIDPHQTDYSLKCL